MTVRRVSIPVVAACVVLASAAGSAAEASKTKWEFATGLDYSTGSYVGDVDTDILYVPVMAKVLGEHVKFELTVPFMRLTGPGNVVGGSGPIVVGPIPGARVTHSGPGDVTAAISLLLPRLGTNGPYLDVKMSSKLATAASGLGTDRNDYSVQLSGYQLAGANLTLIAMLGYQKLGDLPGTKLRDGLIGTLGFDVKTGPKSQLGLLFDYRNRSLAGFANQESLTPYLSWRVGSHLGTTLYGVIGLTDTSPDYGAGVLLTYYRR